jgi:hypothetical protein
MFNLIAQTTDVGGFGPSAWGALVGAIGVPVILAWYLWYKTSVSDPTQAEANRKSNEQIANKFSDTVVEVVDKFSLELREERKAREEMTKSFQCRAPK